MKEDFDYLFKRNINRMDLKSKLEYHKANPNQSLTQYKKVVDVILDKELQPLKKVYLDTSIWINILNALNTSNKEDIYFEIFQVLKSKVKAGLIICPFSDILFAEILKQTDPNSRRKTVQIADILSGNYCIKPFYYLIQCEVYNLNSLINNQENRISCYKWSRPISLLGNVNLEANQTTPEALIQIKVTYDGLLATTFQEIVASHDTINHNPSIPEWHMDFFNNIKESTKSLTPPKTETLQINELISSYKSIIEFLDLKTTILTPQTIKNNISAILEISPALYTFSAIYASLQKNITRKIKANDFYDILHSSLAVATSDLLFTEKSFASLLNELNLSKKFNIEIRSKPIEMLELIKNI